MKTIILVLAASCLIGCSNQDQESASATTAPKVEQEMGNFLVNGPPESSDEEILKEALRPLARQWVKELPVLSKQGPDCDAKWSRAVAWVKDNSHWPKERILETISSALKYRVRWTAELTFPVANAQGMAGPIFGLLGAGVAAAGAIAVTK